ncbi:MAG: hypothetical protein QW666_03270 [Candidatus Woesearchaeota archaeon]
MITITLMIGLCGMVLVLLAFLMNQTHIWKDTDLIYDGTNFLGGALLVWYAWIIYSWPFLLLNAVWTLWSLRDVYIDITKKPKQKRKAHVGHKKR